MDKQRRTLLKGIGAGSMALVFPVCYGKDEPPGAALDAAADPAADPGLATGTRRSVVGMDTNDPVLETYRAAVQAMRALPSGDPRSWESQAGIHLDFCPHGNWYFLPWHRAYLHRFEAICRDLTGDDGFRLPYWDWSNEPRVPPPFWGQDNPLNHSRSAGPSDQALAEMVGQSVIDDLILPETDFEEFGSGASATQRGNGFYGPLEARPHNHVHGFVGGDMQTFMSPRDPIFWLHHANVDRIWAQWNARGNGNTAAAGWRDFEFSGNFVDVAGNPVTVRVADMEDTRQLGYVYDDVGSFDVPSPVPQFALGPQAAAISFEAANDRPSLPGQTVSVAVPADVAQLRRVVSGAQAAGPSRVYALIADIEAPENEEIIVRVFVNKPDVTPDTPISDPHYAGSFGFFSFAHAAKHGHAPSSYRIDVTDTLRRLAASDGGIGAELQVQLLPVALSGRDVARAEFTARKIGVVAR